ncbi:hypothetical protein B0H14DRAFT_2627414 [Mycena olivaceomarginata]|nr:hypothetical protein B0H14DRAFT_2627414 [Mycena olivaceomarginata]
MCERISFRKRILRLERIVAKTMGCARKVTQKNCLSTSEESDKPKMKAFNSAAEHGIALGGSGGLKDCGDIKNCRVENNLAAGIISELYDLTRRKSRGWGDGLMFASTDPSTFEEPCATDHVRYPGTTVESKEQDIADSEHPKA